MIRKEDHITWVKQALSEDNSLFDVNPYPYVFGIIKSILQSDRTTKEKVAESNWTIEAFEQWKAEQREGAR